jgi:hypothetical protein
MCHIHARAGIARALIGTRKPFAIAARRSCRVSHFDMLVTTVRAVQSLPP